MKILGYAEDSTNQMAYVCSVIERRLSVLILLNAV